MKKRTQARIDQINDKIGILSVLDHYGYHVHAHGGDHEQQFPCDLHGDGFDTKPSARVYPDSNSFYCWACHKSYDIIRLTCLKDRLTFMEAVRHLEGKYRLPSVPWMGEDEDEGFDPRLSGDGGVGAILQQGGRDFKREVQRLDALLTPLANDRLLPLGDMLIFWESLDRVSYQVKNGLDEGAGIATLDKIRERIMEAIKREANADLPTDDGHPHLEKAP